MIRLWLSRGTSIPIREQLRAQFVLGILSCRLAPGERLPSVRELARRLDLHANTISAVYQDLADQGWVIRRRGSRVSVRHPEVANSRENPDGFMRACIDEGLACGFSLDVLRSSFERMVQASRAQEFLIIDPDPHLGCILAAEIAEATGRVLPVTTCEEALRHLSPGTCVLATEAQLTKVRQAVGDVSFRKIQLNSMQDVLAGHVRPTSAILIAVVSVSESILSWASKLLSALGFSAEEVLLRNPRDVGWQDGLEACGVVAADIVTAAALSKNINPILFRVVSNAFLAELRELMTA